ncbi:MAG TPA: hypothetical protein VFZ09_51430 [Archangium sp.]|uniref:hypothetical protein n=1 Tax=Archangium sp. TaxID=1872627 RepID=UPI002E2F04B9|nr:hypothetical protein [Archangium sp.]HEX5754701.1 hypothetical protein [Archangium sp.]
MALNLRKRLAVAGAVLGASLFTLAVANAQFDPTTGQPTTPGISPTPPGLTPPPGVSPSPGSVPTTTPSPYDTDGGLGGSGINPMPSYPSPFDSTDAGLGGSGGLMPPPILGDLDAGLR